MSLRPRKGTGRRAAKQREQKLRDKLHWKNQGGKEYGELFDRIQAIDEVRDRLTPSQRNRFLQIEDDFYNEQATPAFVDQDLMALEKELRGTSKKWPAEIRRKRKLKKAREGLLEAQREQKHWTQQAKTLREMGAASAALISEENARNWAKSIQWREKEIKQFSRKG